MEHASQENRKKVIQIFPARMCNVTAWLHSRLRAHWLMALVGGGEGWGRSMYSAISGNFSVSRSLWAALNGGENSLHWKANLLLYLVLWLCDHITSKVRKIILNCTSKSGKISNLKSELSKISERKIKWRPSACNLDTHLIDIVSCFSDSYYYFLKLNLIS